MLQFRKATAANIELLADLINASYRSGEGWTHEAELLVGPRISSAALAQLLEAPNSHLETAWSGIQLLGCVHLRRVAPCQLGLLSVHPAHQQRGLGRELLERAKELARSWNCPSIFLTVISQRPELVAYYERRGYWASGQRFPFPFHEAVGQASRDDLELIEMSLDLTASRITNL